LFERRIDQIVRYSAAPSEHVVSSKSLFELFLHNQYERYESQLPRSLNSCCSRDLLTEIRASTGGLLCLPGAPDYNLAFLTLLHRASVVLIKEPLFIWGSALPETLSEAKAAACLQVPNAVGSRRLDRSM